MRQKIIIYDLETNSTDVKSTEPKIMGFKSSEYEGFHWTTDKKQMVALLEYHDIIVGWNQEEFDNEIMKRYGARLGYKINVDLMRIIHGKGFGNDKGRIGIMSDPNGKQLAKVLHGKSLAECTKALGGPLKIGDFDYDLFKKDFSELTPEQQNTALEYLEADIDATEHIYRYCEKFFTDLRDGGLEINGEFKPYMTDEQKRKKLYLTASTAAWTYKALCNLAGIEEKYVNAETEDYGGGFVALPTVESCRGKIYCLDYNSLYPHIMIQANLYGPRKEIDNGWRGQGISETKGFYDCRTLAPVGEVLKAAYGQRLKYKAENDSREYTTKIIINTIYGLLGNPTFASVSDYTAAADCTALGRQWVQAARAHFADNGYNILYTDTDSVYLEDVFDDKERLMRVKEEHINAVKASVPFPQDTFDMGIDDEISYIAFFKSVQGDTFKKKNYLYVAFNKKTGAYDKLVVKGLPVIKSDATPLSKAIFDKHIAPMIIKDLNHTVAKSQIEEWIEQTLREDITLASRFYKIKEAVAYKNASQLQAQVARSNLYGPGQHRLIKMKTPHEKGVGTNKNYVGVQYADEIRVTMIDLDKTWSELTPFIKQAQKGLERFW